MGTVRKAAVVVVFALAAAGTAATATAATATAATATPTPGVVADAGTAYVWSDGGDGTSWGDANNWSPVGVPGNGDSATVQAASDVVCHAHVVGVPTGLQLTNLTIDEILFQGDPDSPCLTSISGGSITVTGLLTFHAGIIDTAVTIAPGASASVTPGAAHDTTHFSQAVTVQGAMTLADDAGEEFLSLSGGPGITVAAGGTLTTQGTNRIYADCCNSPAHLTNNGTVHLGGTATLDSVELDQNAALDATGGARILTDFAPQTAGAGATWTGTGSWLLGYSSATTVSGTQTLGSGFAWEFGGNGSTAEEYLRGTFALAGSGRFRWGGGAIDAAMTVGSGITFTADGPDGPDPREIDGDGTGSGHIAVVNRGTMSFTGGAGWYGIEGGQLTNAASGVLDLGAGTSVGADCCNDQASIVNSGGQVVVPAGAGTVVVDETGYRATGGTLSVGAGSDLRLTGGATGSLSNTTISGGGTVEVVQGVSTSGTETVGSATTVVLEKGGAITTTGKTATTIGGSGSFGWTGGSVVGTLTVTATGGQTLSGTTDPKQVVTPTGGKGTTVTFAGPTTVAAGTTKAPDIVQSDPASKVRFTGALSLRGNTRFVGGAITTSGATTVAAGNGQAYATNNATFGNSGTLVVSTGVLATDNDLVQTAGSITVAAGATVKIVGSAAALRVSAGTLAGAGQVTGNVAVGGGTLAPGVGGTGKLTVTGTLSTGTGATVQLELGSAARDQLKVGGTATLHGSLALVDLAGYQPATGDVVTVVNAGSLTASFGCTATTGPGAATQHWVAKVVSGTSLQLVSKAGASAGC